MRKKIILIVCLTAILQPDAFSQNILSGIIRLAGQPISGATVYTSFGTSDPSDKLGRYSLSLGGCAACRPGDRINIYVYHEVYGNTELVCTISNDYKFDITISNNPTKVLVVGIVVNSAANSTPIPNVEVKLVGIDMPPVLTDNYGHFKIYIHKTLVEKSNAVQLQVLDPNKIYKPLRVDPEYFNINAFAIIRMMPSTTREFSISGFTRTNICVNSGDLVVIEASEHIDVGAFVGSSDPEGRTSGVLGMSLRAYNIVPDFNHAVLMYRLAGVDNQWKVAGKKKSFIPKDPGCIEFQVNDNRQSDNTGSYRVEVTVHAQ